MNGYRICGARCGDTFVNATRGINLKVGGECPYGYQSCAKSLVPTPENTWCIKDTLNATEMCPITNFAIITLEQLALYPT